MRVCGIDPGLQVTGYAVLAVDDGAVKVVEAGVVRTGSRSAAGPLDRRLAKLQAGIEEVLAEHDPALVAVEALYWHYRHPRTAVIMGHARGVILAAAGKRGVEVVSFSATEVKKGLTGNGRASKLQVQRAIMASLGLSRLPEPPDVADALAVAICAARRCCRRALR